MIADLKLHGNKLIEVAIILKTCQKLSGLCEHLLISTQILTRGKNKREIKT